MTPPSWSRLAVAVVLLGAPPTARAAAAAPPAAAAWLGSPGIRGEERVSSLAFSPDERLLAVADAAGSVGLWEVGTGRFVRRLSAGFRAPGVAFSPDGRRL